MALKEKDIVYENGDFWVYQHPRGDFEVYRIESCYSVRCAIIGYKGEEGLARAKAECDRRAAG